MNLEANNMDEIVALIMKELKKTDIKAGCQSCESPKNGVFSSMDEAIAAAKKAQEILFSSRLEMREKIVASIREETSGNNRKNSRSRRFKSICFQWR